MGAVFLLLALKEPALEMSNCIFDVTGYAVRAGVNGTVNAEQKEFAITNSTLKSACAESDDAVIVIRTSATKAKLTLTSTTLIGALNLVEILKKLLSFGIIN
ncbi:MAG: hypothetical protein J6V04_06600 [Bacteroidales bacterium]|nr:hypothetical protein [Bacteroidales bacterium]